MASNSCTDSLPAPAAPGIPSTRVYLIGLALGYFLLGPKAQPPAPPVGMPPGGHPKPTMEQMKAMAEVKAAPLLEALKTKPKDAPLLAQIAALYSSPERWPLGRNCWRPIHPIRRRIRLSS
jgi:hypothetical protein